jgi:hypothetical protein
MSSFFIWLLTAVVLLTAVWFVTRLYEEEFSHPPKEEDHDQSDK